MDTATVRVSRPGVAVFANSCKTVIGDCVQGGNQSLKDRYLIASANTLLVIGLILEILRGGLGCIAQGCTCGLQARDHSAPGAQGLAVMIASSSAVLVGSEEIAPTPSPWCSCLAALKSSMAFL